MKRIITLILTIVFVISCTVCNAETSTDKKMVQDYCTGHYPDMQVRYFEGWNEDVITHRANNNVLYVQVETSISSGEIDPNNGMCWGYIEGQNYYKTWYNKKVAKGEVVKSYYIYNPYTNYEDDIILVIDNEEMR